MKTILFLFLSALTTSVIYADVAGPLNANTFSNSSIPGSNKSWVNVGNAAYSDNVFTTFGNLTGGVGSYTDYIVATNFNFNIPKTATVTGIVVDVERMDANSLTSDYSIRIVRGGVIGNAERSIGLAYPTTNSYQSYGSKNDMWGESWTYFDIENPGFGVAIAAQRSTPGGTTAGEIDHIRISVYYSYMTLPVNLISFDAIKNNKSIELEWSTANENSMDHYEVERSADGKNFTSLNTIHCLNQTNNNYSVVDNDPLQGISYYRLKMVGNSNNIKYSKIISVEFNPNDLILYPTLLNQGGNLYITNTNNLSLGINFYSLTGRLLFSVLTHTNQVPLNQPSLLKGMVFYKVYNSGEQEVGNGKILIQ